MIMINNSIPLQSEEDINMFMEEVKEQTYDDTSVQVCDVIHTFLKDVWERDEKLTYMIQKKISRVFYPVEFVDLTEEGDWTKLNISMVPINKGYREKLSDVTTFNGLCDLFFKDLKPLYTRLSEIQ